MPASKAPPASLAWTVFRGSDAVRQGLLTADKLRSSAWLRLRQDVYADARLDRDHALACHGAVLALPEDAVIAGRSAAYRHGVDHAASFTDPVHVIVPADSAFGARTGLVVHRLDLTEDEVITLGRDRCTAPARTAWDVASWSDVYSAVSIVDVLLRHELVTPAGLRQFSAERPGARGSRRAAQVFGLADGRAQSPPESRLRVRLVLAGLPTPVPQCPVRVDSGLVLHPDFGWPEFKVALEYDGQWHAGTEQLRLDRRRLNLLLSAGWIVLHATSDRVSRDLTGLLREIEKALRSRGWRT